MSPPAEYEVVAVGGGPANLSFAALYGSAAGRAAPVLERSPGPAWHAGLLLPGARLQTSWIKDLVSLVDPRHELSFLNYVVTTGRVYAFLNAQFDAIPRLEYACYLRWAAQRLDVRYGTPVDRVQFDGSFHLHSAGTVVARARHVVFGLGTVAHVPACFLGRQGDGVIVAEQLGERLPALEPDRSQPVVVVGGGQTGAECVLALLQRGFQDVQWLGRRHWFAPLDDSPSANDLYRPSYSRFFQGLPEAVRESLLQEQVLTSDGVSMASLQEIYQTQYEGYLRQGRSPLALLPGREVVAVGGRGDTVSMRCRLSTGGHEFREARHVILATGRRPSPLPLDPELAELIELDSAGQPVVEGDYCLRWKHGYQNRIYVQNRSRVTHGINDPNLSLLSVRAATIINSVLECEAYTVRDEQNFTYWPAVHAPTPEGDRSGL